MYMCMYLVVNARPLSGSAFFLQFHWLGVPGQAHVEIDKPFKLSCVYIVHVQYLLFYLYFDLAHRVTLE